MNSEVVEKQVIRTAWRLMSLYYMRGRNWRTYMRFRGWVFNESTKRFVSPYNGEHCPWGRACHLEREMVRGDLLTLLNEAGFPVPTAGKWTALTDDLIKNIADPIHRDFQLTLDDLERIRKSHTPIEAWPDDTGLKAGCEGG